MSGMCGCMMRSFKGCSCFLILEDNQEEKQIEICKENTKQSAK